MDKCPQQDCCLYASKASKSATIFLVSLIVAGCFSLGEVKGQAITLRDSNGLYVKPYVAIQQNIATLAGTTKFYLTNKLPGKLANIELRFTYNNNQLRISTGEKVSPSVWDGTRHRIAAKHERVNDDYYEINRVLDDLAVFVRRTYDTYRRGKKLDDLTVAVFKGIVTEELTGVPPVSMDAVSVLDFYEQFLDIRARAGKIMGGHNSAHAHFAQFAATRPGPIRYDQIKLRFFEQFRDYLWGLDDNLVDNTVYKHIQRVLQFFIYAAADGKQMGANVQAIKIKTHLGVSNRAMDTIGLSEDQLQSFLDLEFEKEYTTNIRDLFIVGCYTGLRLNRWGEVKRDNFQNIDGVDVLQIFTKKGERKSIALPIHPQLRTVLDRHNWSLPRVPAGQVINRNLRAMGEKIGMTDELTLSRFVKGKSELFTFRRCDLVTSHTARRSFVTNAYIADIPKDDIRAITGHSLKMVEHYIKEAEVNRAQRLSRSDWFTKK